MTEYYISEFDNGVSIALNKPKNDVDALFDGFIDIYSDDCDMDSPFENIETARTFAEIIVKLLKVVR